MSTTTNQTPAEEPGNETACETNNLAQEPADALWPAGGTAIYRDPADTQTIAQLSAGVLLLSALLLVAVALNLILYLRKPDLVVVDKTSGRALSLNNREYGQTDAVQLGPEQLTNQDKEYLVRQFLQAIYQVDRATRPADINRALRMMEPDASLRYARFLKDSRTLETEEQEQLQAAWEVQQLQIDERDPYLVRVVGERSWRRKTEGEFRQQKTQITVKLLLSASNTAPKRNDNNLRTGFYVLRFKAEPLHTGPLEPLTLLTEETAMAQATPTPTGKINR